MYLLGTFVTACAGGCGSDQDRVGDSGDPEAFSGCRMGGEVWNGYFVIGSPGAGKSTFSRRLREGTGLPLYYLDMLWHRPDRTTVEMEVFDRELGKFWKRTGGISTEIISVRWKCA